MAPEVGLEPTTTRLTAACSTIELLWNPKDAQSTDRFRQRQFDSAGHLILRALVLRATKHEIAVTGRLRVNTYVDVD